MDTLVTTQSCTMQLLYTQLPKSRSSQQYQLLCFARKVVNKQINTKSQLNWEINIVWSCQSHKICYLVVRRVKLPGVQTMQKTGFHN